MADTNARNFDRRMTRLIAKHQKLSRGYVPKITEDGLIVAEPRRTLRLPWRPVLTLLVGAVLLKALAHAAMGPEAYDAQVAVLRDGGQVERIGAWVMTADPVTRAVSDQLAIVFGTPGAGG